MSSDDLQTIWQSRKRSGVDAAGCPILETLFIQEGVSMTANAAAPATAPAVMLCGGETVYQGWP